MNPGHIKNTRFKLILLLLVVPFTSAARSTSREEELKEKLYRNRLELWARGSIDAGGRHYDNVYSCATNTNGEGWMEDELGRLEREVQWAPLKLGPIRDVRQRFLEGEDGACIEFECPDLLTRLRGGGIGGSALDGNGHGDRLKAKLDRLSSKYGEDFVRAIARNEKEHEEDCEISCQSFYCASASSNTNNTTWDANGGSTGFQSYSFGATPPEDFADDFGFPLDLIKVTTGQPLFSREEAFEVVKTAEGEGVDKNEYQSGKYKLGGDWLLNLPKTRAWFNRRLETTFFPLLADLFPEIVSSPSVLRAHSVSLLKYNSSHPRTDVHIDNGILAMTLAMTPKTDYVGGGTFFEHMSTTVPMDVGHGTFRPGSVRHGGHKVTKGTRYILGAFILIKDRVEHVRRLKNRGSELRRKQDLSGAAKHFEWALALNPQCTTCLKDWGEILLTEKRYDEAEEKMREVLRLLEDKDSDALFSLGVVLSEAGKDDESIEAYTKSVELNAEDAELCYNLGIKLGGKGDIKAEMSMYARATSVDPTFGGAWLNWGTTLAESGNMDDAEVMFLKGSQCEDVKAKAMMNLALVYQKKGESLAATGDFSSAKDMVTKAANYLDTAKPLLEDAVADGKGGSDERNYIAQYSPLRLQCHRLLGSILFSLKDFESCENEFRRATESFPNIRGAWEMLGRVLELQGKADAASKVREKIISLF